MNEGDFVDVCGVEEIGPGGKYVLVGEEEILLVRRGEEIHALSYLCSHQDMELEGGRVEENAWVCPHHGARFDLKSGKALSMPAVEGVPVYETRVESDRVYVKEPSA